MGSRLALQKELSAIKGVQKAYFQPPASVRMKYPCIVYELSHKKIFHADDRIYRFKNRYSVTVIDSDPDSKIPDLVLTSFPYCAFDRLYKADNLYHYVFTLFY